MNKIVEKAVEIELSGDASAAMKILYPELDRLTKENLWAEIQELFEIPLNFVPINISVAILIFTAKGNSRVNLPTRPDYAKRVMEHYNLKEEFFYGLK